MKTKGAFDWDDLDKDQGTVRSVGLQYIKGTDESTLGKDASVSLMQLDLTDLGSLILCWMIPKKCTPRVCSKDSITSGIKY